MTANSISENAMIELNKQGLMPELTHESLIDSEGIRILGTDLTRYPDRLIKIAGSAVAAKIASEFYDPTDARLKNLAIHTEVALTQQIVKWIAEHTPDSLAEQMKNLTYPAHLNNLSSNNLRSDEQTHLFRQAIYDLKIMPFDQIVEVLGDQLMTSLAKLVQQKIGSESK